MRIQAVLVVAAFGVATLVSASQMAGADEVPIPKTADITAVSGKPTVIYGQRGRECGDGPPSFDRAVKKAVTRAPTNGTLSDGGIGKRQSRRCGKTVPVRAISYTSEPGFTGTDGVVFWDWEGVVITVAGE